MDRSSRLDQIEKQLGIVVLPDKEVTLTELVDPRIDGEKPPIPYLRIFIPGDRTKPVEMTDLSTAKVQSGVQDG